MLTVFISDLHLHPDDADITARFDYFISWAKKYAQTVYILGDFFHAWAGDDGLNAWSLAIAEKLHSLKVAGIQLFFMHGNRDFLVGDVFFEKAGLTLLKEPMVIYLGQQAVLLAHGDRYCKKDKSHQYLRALTRNIIFPRLFLKIPYRLRTKIVGTVRKRSQAKTYDARRMGVDVNSLLAEMKKYGTRTLIHGHTHTAGLTQYPVSQTIYNHYILSDWDDNPRLLCYDESKGIYFVHLFVRESHG